MRAGIGKKNQLRARALTLLGGKKVRASGAATARTGLALLVPLDKLALGGLARLANSARIEGLDRPKNVSDKEIVEE